MDELAGVGAYVEHEVDGELGEEEVVAELLRGVDTGLPDLEACGFGEGAQGVFEMGIHSPQFSVVSFQVWETGGGCVRMRLSGGGGWRAWSVGRGGRGGRKCGGWPERGLGGEGEGCERGV